MAIDVNSLNFNYSMLNAVRDVRRSVGAISEQLEKIDRQDRARLNAGEDRQKNGRSQGFLYQDANAEERALARLRPLRAQLAPSDEAALFGARAEGLGASPLASTTGTQTGITIGEAVDDSGESVAVEIITPQSAARTEARNTPEPNVLPLNLSKQQFAVSQLYARNNDVVFTANQQARLAA